MQTDREEVLRCVVSKEGWGVYAALAGVEGGELLERFARGLCAVSHSAVCLNLCVGVCSCVRVCGCEM